MAEEVTSLSLVGKLAKIREMVPAAEKSKDGYGYKYVDITDILARVTSGMRKYHVSLIPWITPGTSSVGQVVNETTKVAKNGDHYVKRDTEMMYHAEVVFKWVNNDKPDEVIEVPWFIVGAQSDPSQAFGTSLSYGMRQFLMWYFQIAQADNDVDSYRSKQKEADARADMEAAAVIIGEFDTEVKNYLKNADDKTKQAVKKLCEGYVKSANYMSIKDPEVATQLVTAFRDYVAANTQKGETNV